MIKGGGLVPLQVWYLQLTGDQLKGPTRFGCFFPKQVSEQWTKKPRRMKPWRTSRNVEVFCWSFSGRTSFGGIFVGSFCCNFLSIPVANIRKRGWISRSKGSNQWSDLGFANVIQKKQVTLYIYIHFGIYIDGLDLVFQVMFYGLYQDGNSSI